jgi:hypothetical protein
MKASINCIHLAQNKAHWRDLVNMPMNSRREFAKGNNLLHLRHWWLDFMLNIIWN